MNWLRNIAEREHRFTFRSVWRTCVRFIVRYVIVLVSVGIVQNRTRAGQQPPTVSNLIWIFSIALLLVLLDYIKDAYQNTKRSDKEVDERTFFVIISNAIEHLIEARGSGEHTAKVHVEDILTRIEAVTKRALQLPETTDAAITANLMVAIPLTDKSKQSIQLKLKYWGIGRTSDRHTIELNVDRKKPNPGAPEAYVFNKTVYVNNTLAETYKAYFQESRPYRSIVSFPVVGYDAKVFAVVNVDSNVPDMFKSDDFISHTLLPRIRPLLHLLSLEQELITKPHKVQKEAGSRQVNVVQTNDTEAFDLEVSDNEGS